MRRQQGSVLACRIRKQPSDHWWVDRGIEALELSSWSWQKDDLQRVCSHSVRKNSHSPPPTCADDGPWRDVAACLLNGSLKAGVSTILIFCSTSQKRCINGDYAWICKRISCNVYRHVRGSWLNLWFVQAVRNWIEYRVEEPLCWW